MTAEIAVMNREAVALAADSAVTLDFSSGPKVFSSANKIFALSAVEPVGLMVFGGASFVGMPWETIIKEFRGTLGSEALANVTDYADRFLSDLLNHPAFTGPDAERRSFSELVYEGFSAILQAFLRTAERGVEKRGTIDEKDVRALLAVEVTAQHKAWAASTELDDIPDGFAAKLRKRYATEIRELRKVVFEDLPISAATSRALGEIAGLLFTHSVPAAVELPFSGVVIAGFGKDEFFPHLTQLRVFGVAGERLRVERREEVSVRHDNNAVIAPFAQREMVDAFIEGLEPSYGRRADRESRRLSRELIESALEEGGLDDGDRDRVMKAITKDLTSRFETLTEELRAIRYERNVLPIIEVVAALPKDELAAMAESLVNLTSFKRRVSKSAETVGGPIDVAVISRGDGFVWIKRKHYFPSELNPRYMVNLKGGSQ